jgi:DNA-binding beta-propeller fold protein YncE
MLPVHGGAAIPGRAILPHRVAGPQSLAVFVAGAAVAGLGTAAQPGQLVQLAGRGACVSQLATEGICAGARALNGPDALAVSPDGRNVYAASSGVAPNVSGNAGSIAVFARDRATGRITQPAGAAGCVGDLDDGCGEARAVQGTSAVAVSANGRHVYATGFASGSVATFDRSSGGVLTQLPGAAGCAGADPTEGCTAGSGLRGAADIAITRDGANLYVASARSNAVAAFSRNASSGQLQQLAGEAACTVEQEADEDVGDEGLGAPVENCRSGRGLIGASAVTASPDGKNVYVLARDAIAAFRRGPGGVLTQLPGLQGCLAVDGRGGACTTVPQLSNGLDLSISPDGLTLYVPAYYPGSIVLLRRDPFTGSLGRVTALASPDVEGVAGITITPDGEGLYAVSPFRNAVLAFRRATDGRIIRLPGAAGCVSDVENSDSCAHGQVLSRASASAISPDGRHLYVSAVEPIGFSCACGRELGSLSVFTRSAATVSVSVAVPRAAAVPRSGKPFRITARVRTTAPAVKVTCAASAGGRAIRTTGTYAAGAAVCTGVVPKGAVGRLTGALSVTAGGATGRTSFSFSIR